MTNQNIEDIIVIFQKVGVWNNGKFAEQVKEYCNTNGLDLSMVNSKLEIAFRDYLATNIKSEAAIRLRLTNLIPKNVAL